MNCKFVFALIYFNTGFRYTTSFLYGVGGKNGKKDSVAQEKLAYKKWWIVIFLELPKIWQKVNGMHACNLLHISWNYTCKNFEQYISIWLLLSTIYKDINIRIYIYIRYHTVRNKNGLSPCGILIGLQVYCQVEMMIGK